MDTSISYSASVFIYITFFIIKNNNNPNILTPAPWLEVIIAGIATW